MSNEPIQLFMDSCKILWLFSCIREKLLFDMLESKQSPQTELTILYQLQQCPPLRNRCQQPVDEFTSVDFSAACMQPRISEAIYRLLALFISERCGKQLLICEAAAEKSSSFMHPLLKAIAKWGELLQLIRYGRFCILFQDSNILT